MNLNGKIAIVTGASRGIGRAIAINLASKGASVVINYSKDEVGANEVLREVIGLGGYGKVIKADISNFSEANYLVEESIRLFGRVDILINNAGISYNGLFIDMSKEAMDRVIDVNIKGTMYMCHSFLQKILGKSGVIINVSSIWGQVGASCEAVYCASKGAVNLLTNSLAKEMGLSGVRINAVAPGVIETNMNNNLSSEEKDMLCDEIAVGRFGKCEEVANVVAFLCSEEASYINGKVITIDGGMI